jgi:hypothetical protein
MESITLLLIIKDNLACVNEVHHIHYTVVSNIFCVGPATYAFRV